MLRYPDGGADNALLRKITIIFAPAYMAVEKNFANDFALAKIRFWIILFSSRMQRFTDIARSRFIRAISVVVSGNQFPERQLQKLDSVPRLSLTRRCVRLRLRCSVVLCHPIYFWTIRIDAWHFEYRGHMECSLSAVFCALASLASKNNRHWEKRQRHDATCDRRRRRRRCFCDGYLFAMEIFFRKKERIRRPLNNAYSLLCIGCVVKYLTILWGRAV